MMRSQKIPKISWIILALGIALLLVNAANAEPSAESLSKITYPVAELGNCQNEADCRTHCDKPQNLRACVNFAKAKGLMPEDEIAEAEKFLAAAGKGPGGCATKDKCESYCNDINNMDECLAFAEKSGIMPQGELEEARKVQKALKEGAKLPGGCTSKAQCEEFCTKPENMEECVTFAETAGFMQGEELAEAKKVLAAIKQGAKPPPCRSKKDCDAYCGDPANMEMCIDFATKAGLMPPEEAENAAKMLKAVRAGVKPPACRGREECDTYCSAPEHEEECYNFAEVAGFITEEDKARMREGMEKFNEGLKNAPAGVLECLKNTVGAEVLDQITSGTKRPSRDLGDKMRACFEAFFESQGGLGGPGGGGMSGPPPEILKCLEEKGIDFKSMGHDAPPPAGAEECFKNFVPQGGSGGAPFRPQGDGEYHPPEGAEFSGPGRCKTPEECRVYCESNPGDCGGFRPPEGSFVPIEGAPMPSPDGSTMPPSEDQYREQYQEQYEQQYRDQFEQQYQQQYQEQYQQYQNQYPQPTEVLPPPPTTNEPPPPQPLGASVLRTIGKFIIGLFGW